MKGNVNMQKMRADPLHSLEEQLGEYAVSTWKISPNRYKGNGCEI